MTDPSIINSQFKCDRCGKMVECGLWNWVQHSQDDCVKPEIVKTDWTIKDLIDLLSMTPEKRRLPIHPILFLAMDKQQILAFANDKSDSYEMAPAGAETLFKVKEHFDKLGIGYLLEK